MFEGRPRVWDLPWLGWYREGKESVQMRLALENSKIEMKGDWKKCGDGREESWLSRE